MRRALLLGLVLSGSGTPAPGQEAPAAGVPALSDATFKPLLEFVRAKPRELGFEEIRWRPTFWEGVVEGQREGKPVLVWAMNGHPLACT